MTDDKTLPEQPVTPVEPEPGACAPARPSAPDGVSNGASADAPRSAAHLLGLPDALPETWCAKCAAIVKPIGRGQCPRCGRVLKQSFLARRHPVNRLRRDQLLAKLVADYAPTTTVLQATCEMLAGILEQLEVLKPGSPEHQRLVQLSQVLGAALDASPHDARTPESLASLSIDQLIERATRSLTRLLDMKDEEQRHAEFLKLPCHPDGTDGGPAPDSAAGSPVQMPASTCGEGPASTLSPAPELCPYCHRAPCIGVDHVAYRVLHWRDPQEVARRDDARTAEMYRMVGRPLGAPNMDVSRASWPDVDPYAGLSPEDRERERKAAEIRSRLGWDARTLKT